VSPVKPGVFGAAEQHRDLGPHRLSTTERLRDHPLAKPSPAVRGSHDHAADSDHRDRRLRAKLHLDDYQAGRRDQPDIVVADGNVVFFGQPLETELRSVSWVSLVAHQRRVLLVAEAAELDQLHWLIVRCPGPTSHIGYPAQQASPGAAGDHARAASRREGGSQLATTGDRCCRWSNASASSTIRGLVQLGSRLDFDHDHA